MHRAVSRRHNLRAHKREGADGEAAEHRAERRPQAGLRQHGLAKRNSAHNGDANQRRQNAEQRGNRKIAPQHIADRTDAQPKRQDRESMSDKIPGHGRHPDRRQACRRVATDHQFKRIKRTGERRPESPGDGGCGATTDHDALIGAAQMETATQ